MARIVALRWTPCDFKHERIWRPRLQTYAAEQGLSVFLDWRGVFACYGLEPPDRAPIMLNRQFGAVFGPIFSKQDPGAAAFSGFDPAQVEHTLDSGGAHLFDACWGHYSAWVHDRQHDRLHVLRDPSGASAVFTAALEGARIFFTHAEDFIALGDGAAAADFELLSAFVAAPRVMTARTGIAGVREILPGERASIGRERDSFEVELLWPPQTIPAQVTPSGFDATAKRLRETVCAAAASWAKTYDHIALRLSGGLDSSIVLSALTAAGAQNLVAINEYAPELPEADERVYARAIAERCKVTLIEAPLASSDIDYRLMQSAPFLARPSLAQTNFASQSAAPAYQNVPQGALIASGQGGDQVFHRAHTSAIAADAWADPVPLAEKMAISFDVARLARRPIWDIWRDVLGYDLLRRPVLTLDPLCVLDDGAGARHAHLVAQEHSWALRARAATPARAQRLMHWSDLQYYHQRDALGVRFQVAPVLTVQPILELCLAIPPYVMTHGGVDRALARAAFRDVLPEKVVHRTAKASTTRFHTGVLERQLGLMRAFLIGGALERAGIVDAARMRAALAQPHIASAAHTSALSAALVAEFWLRRFEALNAAAAQAAAIRASSVQRGDEDADAAGADAAGSAAATDPA